MTSEEIWWMAKVAESGMLTPDQYWCATLQWNELQRAEEVLAVGFERNKDPVYKMIGRACRVYTPISVKITFKGVDVSPNVRITHPFKHG